LVILLAILISSAALLLLVPTTVLFTEVMLAASDRREREAPLAKRQQLAIVMPAHNEASGIAGALRSIIPQLGNLDRLVVVADNCTDQTAAIALAEGAEVIVRTDPILRGKGYALDFGVRHLESNAPDIVMIVDADCVVAADAIDQLARLCAISQRPVQALYLMHAGKDAGLKTRISEFAWVVKNQVRPSGLNRLGLPCQLMGTGMAFPWSCISAARLATGHIVEDLKLGIDLARAGTPPLFCPNALVTSEFPNSAEGVQGQRTRWEHGHLSVILNEAPRLLLDSFARRSVGLMALALDLSVPPLALLVLLVGALWCASALLYVFSRIEFPLGFTTLAAFLLAFSVLLSWKRFGRHVISLGSLAVAMIYPLWKIPLYVKFLVARQLDWVRSRRDADEP
jgi:cellulose synthase/poly-beta-1,6-N-acetylglucosamine synthase-like glycosyltransferase